MLPLFKGVTEHFVGNSNAPSSFLFSKGTFFERGPLKHAWKFHKWLFFFFIFRRRRPFWPEWRVKICGRRGQPWLCDSWNAKASRGSAYILTARTPRIVELTSWITLGNTRVKSLTRAISATIALISGVICILTWKDGTGISSTWAARTKCRRTWGTMKIQSWRDCWRTLGEQYMI